MVNLYEQAYKTMDDYHYKDHNDVVDYIKWLFEHNRDSSLIILAIKDQRLIGFIAGDTYYYDKDLEENVMNIHELVVDPEYRGIGIGTHLIYEFIKRAKEKNKEKGKKVSQVILWVGKENEKAQKLYTNLGFSSCKRSGKWIKMKMGIL